jgi:formylglycine-generating enzyme required for sulfatase activity
VTISQPFYLGSHPVTQAQWEAVMGSNPSRFGGKPEHPVEGVSWDEVQQFLQRLNARRDGNIYRLPSEAQWEYACRAGSTGAYCFGDDEEQLGAYAWYDDNSGGMTHPVGQKQPNAWGLYDMHGNVWEWVQDWHGPYTAESVTDPSGPTTGAHRVVRGGGWGRPAQGARSADRLWDRPGNRLVSLGFRCLSSALSQ